MQRCIGHSTMMGKRKRSFLLEGCSIVFGCWRFRSISVNVRLDPSEDPAMSHRYSLRSRDRVRTVSECVGPSKNSFNLSPPSTLQRFRVYPVQAPFPFQHLPPENKLRIFSFLAASDRATAAQVCHDWNQLIKDKTLWQTVDFVRMKSCVLQHMEGHCTKACYTAYIKRVHSYANFIKIVEPSVTDLRLAFDIGEDGWSDCIKKLLESVRLDDLRYLYFNWQETTGKPYYEGASRTWSVRDNDLSQKLRSRTRRFVQIFDFLSNNAPRITSLHVPFEWSNRSLNALRRLRKLHTLVLDKYWVSMALEQRQLDQMFDSLTSLQSLVLAVSTPSGRGLQWFNIKSDSLRYFDVSASHGFYVKAMYTPQLEVFKVSRNPLSAPFVTPDNVSNPCVYDVIRIGCPALRQINEHVLRIDWRCAPYDELQIVLRSVCSCREHLSSDW